MAQVVRPLFMVREYGV